MFARKVLLAIAVFMFLCGISRAASEDKASALEKENAQLRQRVDNLEKKVDDLTKMMEAKSQPASPAEPNKSAAPAKSAGQVKPEGQASSQTKLSDEDVKKILASLKQNENKKNVFSNLDVELYGMIKLDAAYDSSKTSVGNYAQWVENENKNDHDSQFSMTPKQTRIDMKINGPANDEFRTSGLVEIDFYGTDAGENKAGILLRHAYMQFDWPKDRFSILAGQTSDLISPLFPSTLNYTVNWWVGNIGYRRPQIRFTKIYALDKDVDWTIAGALVRTIGSATNDFTTDAGKASGMPGLQARTALKFPFFGDKPTEVGFSSHWAKEELDTNSYGQHKNFYSWSYNIDITQPVNKWLAFKGELFTGQDLSTYLGGIGQGVNTKTNKEIGSKGGWIAASLGPWDKWNFNLGAGVDTACKDDVDTGGRTLNRNVFGNMIYSFDKNAKVGLELSHWRTEYKGPGGAEDLRAQMSFMYNF
jgi:hypothetical protein